MRTLQKYFVLLITISTLFCTCQKGNKCSAKLSCKLDSIPDLQYFPMGPSEVDLLYNNGVNSDPLYHYYRDSLNLNTLLLLTDDPDNIVKLYAFRAIQEKVDSSLFDIIKKHLSDTTKITIREADTYFEAAVVDVFIRIGEDHLTPEQKLSLRDMIPLGSAKRLSLRRVNSKSPDLQERT